MQLIVCPLCNSDLTTNSRVSECNRGHAFPIVDGIIDLMPDIENDKELFDEEHRWDKVADKGFGEIGLMPNQFIESRGLKDRLALSEHVIKIQWPDCEGKNVSIGEIGCGNRSAMSYLRNIGFANVDYVGIDISIKMMKLAANEGVPKNWKTQFARISANTGVFKENSLDLVACDGVLARLELIHVMEWISKSLKPNGLFILHDYSDGNLFAKFGRKLIPNFQKRYDFDNEGKLCLVPAQVKLTASKQNLHLVFEKGLHFLNGRLQYFAQIVNMPKPIVVCCYYIGRSIDYFVSSPSWSYSFIQVFKKGGFLPIAS